MVLGCIYIVLGIAAIIVSILTKKWMWCWSSLIVIIVLSGIYGTIELSLKNKRLVERRARHQAEFVQKYRHSYQPIDASFSSYGIELEIYCIEFANALLAKNPDFKKV